MMYSSNILFLLLGWVSFAYAATVEVYWDITWVNAAPDGFSRPVIGINGAWPCPLLEANVGDTVIVHVDNKLGNETTGIHFHGINQLGTPEMDGPSSTTQCSIPPGSSMTYQWLVCNPSELSKTLGERRLTLIQSGRCTRHVLVPLPSDGPVSRWTQGANGRPRPCRPIRRQG